MGSLRFAAARKLYCEDGPFARLTADVDGPFMTGDNPVDGTETQTGAAFPQTRREEWVEGMFNLLGCHSAAIVTNHKTHLGIHCTCFNRHATRPPQAWTAL